LVFLHGDIVRIKIANAVPLGTIQIFFCLRSH
jgi:hypothetical protein